MIEAMLLLLWLVPYFGTGAMFVHFGLRTGILFGGLIFLYGLVVLGGGMLFTIMFMDALSIADLRDSYLLALACGGMMNVSVVTLFLVVYMKRLRVLFQMNRRINDES